MNAPWHNTAHPMLSEEEVAKPFPKPGTKWQPLHKKPNRDNKPISIRRFISLAKEKEQS